MYFDDHAPPHFHAIYGDHQAEIQISTMQILKGSLPPRVYGLVIEWAMQHKDELVENWENAVQCKPLSKIEPLE